MIIIHYYYYYYRVIKMEILLFFLFKIMRHYTFYTKGSNLFFFSFVSGEYCVHIAAQRNDLDILRHLVHRGANINARVSIFCY